MLFQEISTFIFWRIAYRNYIEIFQEFSRNFENSCLGEVTKVIFFIAMLHKCNKLKRISHVISSYFFAYLRSFSDGENRVCDQVTHMRWWNQHLAICHAPVRPSNYPTLESDWTPRERSNSNITLHQSVGTGCKNFLIHSYLYVWRLRRRENKKRNARVYPIMASPAIIFARSLIRNAQADYV